ncbi:MAG: choline-sulfatase [Pseudomonadota bacterium]
MPPPNIVIVMADQLAPHWTATYGHAVAKTPNMDALAQRGMRFDAAYCNAPLCAPSRAAFMSGQYASRFGSFDNAAEFPASVPTFAHHLTAAGYRTCLAGRMHFVGPDQTHGFQERITTDVYPADFAWTPDWDNADDRIDSWYHNMHTVREAGTALANFQTDYDDEVGFAANRWLMDRGRDRAAGDTDPFCLVASFMLPHDPYVAKPDFWNLYKDDDIPLPDTVLTRDQMDPFSGRIADGIEAADTHLTDAEIRAARRAYVANVSFFDDKLGQIVRTLDQIGALDDTLIIVTSDHGDMLGERGLWFKMTFFEHSARVPLIMAGPGVARGTAPNACSLVDILPTLLDAAGATTSVDIDGRSLMPLARGEHDPTDEACAEYCAEMTPWPAFMIRRGHLKYIHCEVDPPQLFDLSQDPAELTNLAGHPDYADAASAFANEVARRWDSAALRDRIIASQHARRAVHAAMEAGAGAAWDHNPTRDASNEYVRNHMDWTTAATRSRFPRVE